MNIYCTFVSYAFSLLFLFLQAPLFFSTRQFVMLCLPVRFLSHTVQTGCVFTLRESFQTMPWRPDGQEETHGPESADSSIDAYWLLSQATKGLTLSVSVPAHVRVFVCVWLCERKSEKKRTNREEKSGLKAKLFEQGSLSLQWKPTSESFAPAHQPASRLAQPRRRVLASAHFPSWTCQCLGMKRPHAARRGFGTNTSTS